MRNFKLSFDEMNLQMWTNACWTCVKTTPRVQTRTDRTSVPVMPAGPAKTATSTSTSASECRAKTAPCARTPWGRIIVHVPRAGPANIVMWVGNNVMCQKSIDSTLAFSCPSVIPSFRPIKVCLLNSSYILAWIWMKPGRDVAPQV